MLSIVKTNGQAYCLHVGQKLNYEFISDIAEIQADCDELEVIADRWPSFVPNRIRVVRYFGDIAKMLAQTFC